MSKRSQDKTDREEIRNGQWDAAAWAQLRARFEDLYGNHKKFDQALSRLKAVLECAITNRPSDLRKLDEKRSAEAGWLRNVELIGYTTYVDRFAKTLSGIGDKIDYLEDLGVRYFHLLPFYDRPAGNNDGGFAVSDFKSVAPALGHINDLRAVTARLRRSNISLCADFVLNHVSDEHRWARAAKAGDERYRQYFYVIEDRSEVDEYEKNLREIFPETAPGNFTYIESLEGWVWTTFYQYQWDLNYSNPEVLVSMLEEFLFLANCGVEIFRLDSAPFLWKKLGTDCENLPQTHAILSIFRNIADIVAPATALKAEAIEPAAQVARYFGAVGSDERECDLAYNVDIMTSIWEAAVTQNASHLRKAVSHSIDSNERGVWLNYIRCHDDIGFATLSDYQGDEARRQKRIEYLCKFLSGETPNSFSLGKLYQQDEMGRSQSIVGATASLAGLEQAMTAGDKALIDQALSRIKLLYSTLIMLPGIPLINMGDELGLFNDYEFKARASFDGDERWLHRVEMNWDAALRRHGPGYEGEIFSALKKAISLRRKFPIFNFDLAVAEDGGDGAAFLIRYVKDENNWIFTGNFSTQEMAVDISSYGDNWVDLGAEGDNASCVFILPALDYRWLRGGRSTLTSA